MKRVPELCVFLCCLLAVAYIVGESRQWIQTIQSLDDRFEPVHAATGEPAPAHGGRIFLDNDSLYWIAYARQMAAERNWRIRHTEADNTPEGRPVHWSQSISWLLLTLGWLRSGWTGEVLPDAIERAATAAGPLQLIVFVSATGLVLLRRWGAIPAMLWITGLSSMVSLEWSFNTLRPDHHGLHLIASAGSLLFLVLGGLGWTRAQAEPDPASGWMGRLTLPAPAVAKHYFIGSALLGSLGMWTGATMQVAGIGLFAGTALVLALAMPKEFAAYEEGVLFEPDLWRLWGRVGAATSLAFYFLEYAPDFPGMRLEVNHPVYALAWLCTAELLAQLTSCRIKGQWRRRDILWAASLAVGAAILPTLLLLGPADWHHIRDPLMLRQHELIEEFQGFQQVYAGRLGRAALRYFGWMPLFLIVAPVLGSPKRTTLYEWAALSMALCAAVAYFTLTSMQARWIDLAATSNLLLVLLIVMILWRVWADNRQARLYRGLLIGALILQSAYWVGLRQQWFRELTAPGHMNATIARNILYREFAHRLEQMNAGGQIRVFSNPNLTPSLHYYGGVPGVASLYWENIDGLHAATTFFATDDFETARDIAKARGITHVVMREAIAGTSVMNFQYIKTGDRSVPGAPASLGGVMLLAPENLPVWIRRDRELEDQLRPIFRYQENRRLEENFLVFTIQEDDKPGPKEMPSTAD